MAIDEGKSTKGQVSKPGALRKPVGDDLDENVGPWFDPAASEGVAAGAAGSNIPDIRPINDTAEARWFCDALDPSFETLGGLLPSGFEAYARVLHPAWRVRREDGRLARSPVRWAEVAGIRGTVAHRRMQWPQVWALPMFDDPVIEACTEAVLEPIVQPDEGTLPPEVARALIEVLGEHTAAPGSCFVGVWPGFNREYRQGIPETGRISTRARDWDLFRAPLEALALDFFDIGTMFRQSPNLAWPEDRRWCLVTDIDLVSTYVGGPEALIAQILGHESLEAYEAVPEDRFWEDTENPLPPESKHRLGLIADDDMVRFEPLGIRVVRGCYNLLFRLSGGRFPAGGRIIGLK